MLSTVAVVLISVAAILLAYSGHNYRLTDHAGPRALLAFGVTALVLYGCPWCAMGAPDALIALCMGTVAMLGILRLAIGPVRYDMTWAPKLITANATAYRVNCEMVAAW